MMSTADLYVKQLGHPCRQASFGRGDESFRVLKWDAFAHQTAIVIYAAFNGIGVSKVSLVLAVTRAVDSVAGELAWAQRSIEASDNGIRVGDTLDLKKPLWDGSNMNIFDIRAPSPVVLKCINVEAMHNEGVHVLQVVPLFNSETALRNSLGFEQFQQRLAVNDLCLDPDRPPVS
jgi:Suppressor of fused protein (SUFU)